MRQPLIAGNWKMNGSRASVNSLIRGILSECHRVEDIELAVFPSYVFLEQVEQLLGSTPVAWGAQNVSDKPAGAYTGEISAQMLLDFGCRYVIVGHSERRQFYGETNDIVAAKFLQAANAGLRPVLCVGETLQQRETDQTELVIQQQLMAILEKNPEPKLLSQAVIAYEPVWAIGTGKTATPEQAQQVHAFIRQLVDKYDKNIAERLRIIYGGSIKADNARAILKMPDIDGGLIGGASLNAQEFIEIAIACKH